MYCHRPRWAQLGVVLCLLALPLCSLGDERKVVVGPGVTLDGLARRYGVAKQDIAKANGIDPEALLRDGKVLVIPPPPPSVAVRPTSHLQAAIKGNRIGLRLGPGLQYRRAALLDHGAAIVVTARLGEWLQTTVEGRNVWVRSDFVKVNGPLPAAVMTASAAPASHASTPTVRTPAKVVAAPSTPSTRVVSALRCIKGDRVSLRSGPSSDAKRITLVDDGTVIRVTAKSGEWCKAHLENGKGGWVRSDFVAVASRVGKTAAQVLAERRADEEREARRIAAARATRTASSRSPVRHARFRRHSTAESPAPPASGDVLRTAYAFRGTRYRYGGSSQGGFDCSGFTSYVYGRKGVALPHNAAAQFGRGAAVPKSSLKPGDLVFFHTRGRRISHVGIYAGEGKFVHASSARGRVRVDSLNSGYYSERFRGARRVK